MPRAKKLTSEKPVKYVVVHGFQDLEDGGKVYLPNDRFPKPANKKISEERLEMLLSKNNNQKRAVIKEI